MTEDQFFDVLETLRDDPWRVRRDYVDHGRPIRCRGDCPITAVASAVLGEDLHGVCFFLDAADRIGLSRYVAFSLADAADFLSLPDAAHEARRERMLDALDLWEPLP